MSYKSEPIQDVLPRINSTFFLPARQRRRWALRLGERPADSKLDGTPQPQRDVLHSHISQTIAAIARLGDQLDLLDYAVPQLSEILSAEEKALGAALQWGSSQSPDSAARILYEKIQKRTYSLYIKKCRGVLKRNRENKNYYVYTKGCLYPWCRELASLYLKSEAYPQFSPTAV